jgi:hypothetical protein
MIFLCLYLTNKRRKCKYWRGLQQSQKKYEVISTHNQNNEHQMWHDKKFEKERNEIPTSSSKLLKSVEIFFNIGKISKQSRIRKFKNLTCAIIHNMFCSKKSEETLSNCSIYKNNPTLGTNLFNYIMSNSITVGISCAFP